MTDETDDDELSRAFDEEGERQFQEYQERVKDPFYQEAQAVSDKVHELLKGPDGQGVWEGTYETQRVNLTLPKAFVYLADYLAVRDTETKAVPSSFWQSYLRGDFTKIVTRLRNRHMQTMLDSEFHDELHWLATGGHHLYFPEERETYKPPEEGAEPSWQHKQAARLLRLALMRMTAREAPPDMTEVARNAERDEVNALMLAAYEMAGKHLKEAVDRRERRNEPRSSGAFDDDVPF